MYSDPELLPWFEQLRADVPDLELFDAHTHIGSNDPDGFRCSRPELEDTLRLANARAAVFPMHEPDGYPPANDFVIAEAAAANGRLAAFARLDPAHDPVAEARRCLAQGARGIKLHPRAERFGLDHPALDGVFALAEEERVPILVHAGRGIPALGRNVLEQLDNHPGARVILAHAGICDLAWLWRRAEEYPGLYYDTAWWNPADLLTLFALVPPSQVLWASDAPYGTPVASSVLSLRCALQVGLGLEQVRGIAGGQMARLVSGDEPLDLGPPPGDGRLGQDILLERVLGYLIAALGRAFGRIDPSEMLALARLSCEVGENVPQAAVCRSVLALLERRDRVAGEHAARGEEADGRPQPAGIHLVMVATGLVRTPDVPLPPLPEPVAAGERAP